MSAGQRIRECLIGVFMLVLCVLMVFDPESGFAIVVGVLSISLVIVGLRKLFYYFTMARHMVGGKAALYTGIIVLDIGMFAGALNDMPKLYVVLYLLGVHAFAGTIDVLRSMEAKRMSAPSWRTSMASGAINIAISIVCLAFLRSPRMIVYIYAAGLAWSALVRIAGACRKTAIVYIQ